MTAPIQNVCRAATIASFLLLSTGCTTTATNVDDAASRKQVQTEAKSKEDTQPEKRVESEATDADAAQPTEDAAGESSASNCDEIDDERYARVLLETDLDEDGHQDRVVEERGSCGSGSCSAAVFHACPAGGFEMLGLISHWDGVTAQKETSQGWRQLESRGKGVDKDGMPYQVTNVYIWDGESYARKR